MQNRQGINTSFYLSTFSRVLSKQIFDILALLIFLLYYMVKMETNETPTPSTPSPPPPSPDPDIPTGRPQTEDTTFLSKPCRVTSVKFEGANRTRHKLLSKIAGNLSSATTLLDTLEQTVLVTDNLRSLGAFSDVEVQMNQVGNDDAYEVTFLVQEIGRMIAGAHTTVDEHAAHLDLKLSLPNAGGLGDTVGFVTSFGRRFFSGECRYSVPLRPWRQLWAPRFTTYLSQNQWETAPSRYDQEDKSFINQLDFYSLPQLHHAISFENIWRHIRSDPARTTPMEIREQAGHSVKSSIKHILTWDSRDPRSRFPQEGILAKLSNEIALSLVNNGAKFTRHEANLQYNRSILPKYDVLCQLNLLAGTLLRPQKINICDRFFTGGPLTMRGFKLHGLGPNVRGHPLGDISYLTAGMHLYSILPFTTIESPINKFIRPHLFFNTGIIGDVHDMGRLTSRDSLRREATRFRDNLRYSCGFGMVIYFMNLRIEVNYVIPIVYKDNDLKFRGVQAGIGLNYT